MKVAVVTPTINSEHLEQCLESVQSQTHEDLTHYIFIDGENYHDAVSSTISKTANRRKPIKTISLQENIGKGWYGHRVYAACSFLVNADIICYLDEDNWFDPNHVDGLVQKIEQGNDWAFSLRKIYDKNGDFVCEDNCESLGKWPVYFNHQVFHVDTSSFAVKRSVAIQIGHAWYGQWGADRQFFSNIKNFFPRFDCTNEHTLCYRLDGNPKSVTKQFFDEGNQHMKNKYGDSFPWKEKVQSTPIGPGIRIIS